MFWVSRNRTSSSVLAFCVLIALVLGVAGTLQWWKGKSSPQAAVLEEASRLVTAIPGWWYSDYFGYSVCEIDDCQNDSDPDKDKLSNVQEYYFNTNPTVKDTNNNGLTDGEDVAFGYAPNKPGRMTFEEAGSDTNVVGESLVFNNEVKNVINSMTDLSKVVLPEVPNSELEIVDQNSQEKFIDYMLALDSVTNKYYASGMFDGMNDSIKQQDPMVLREITEMAEDVARDYKKVPVPSDALQFHKYQISAWEILPVVVVTPEVGGQMSDIYDSKINQWYDKVQVMISLNQKIAIELQKLRKKYEFQ